MGCWLTEQAGELAMVGSEQSTSLVGELLPGRLCAGASGESAARKMPRIKTSCLLIDSEKMRGRLRAGHLNMNKTKPLLPT